MDQPPQKQPQPAKTPEKAQQVVVRASDSSRWAWPIAIVLVVGMLVGGFLFALTSVAKVVWPPSPPPIFIGHAMCKEMRKESKLVVLTAIIDAHVTSKLEKRILWGKINLGDTVVSLWVPDNRVQYYIPLKDISEASFTYDRAARKVVVKVPSPVLDDGLVEVQADPDKIEVWRKVGWARLSSYSGDYLEKEARKELRPMVVEEARNCELAYRAARLQAEKILRTLFENQAKALNLKDYVSLEVEFEPPKAAPGTDKMEKSGVRSQESE